MAGATTATLVSRETLEDRLRMARLTAKHYDDGAGVTNSRDARRLGRAIENLTNLTIEDGIEGDDERDAFGEFYNALLIDIDRRIVDFADKVENEIRPGRREYLTSQGREL